MERLPPRRRALSPKSPGPAVPTPSSQLHSPVSLSPGNDEAGVQRPNDNAPHVAERPHKSGLKRKRATPSRFRKEERQKVSRACDSCKAYATLSYRDLQTPTGNRYICICDQAKNNHRQKVRCAGTQPCSRCVRRSLLCRYDAEHRRGNPIPPEPSTPEAAPVPHRAVGPVVAVAPERSNHILTPSISRLLNPAIGFNEPPSRSSQEPDETRFQGDYIGPTSGIAFLHRVQRRFQQDFAGVPSSNFDGQLPSPSSVFSFGDGWTRHYSTAEFLFPSRNDAKILVDRYFDFAMPTYRFLHQQTVEGWLDQICDKNENGTAEEKNLSNARHATILLILGTSKLYGEDATLPTDDMEPRSQVER